MTTASSEHRRVTVDVHLTGDDLRASLERDAARGLTATPKDLPPKYFYDTYGSELFDEITRLDEYYPTRAERSILETYADDIVRIADTDTLVELGSGTSEKTRLLLDAGTQAGTLRRFVPFDVSESMLRRAASDVAIAYPTIEVHAVVGDFDHHVTCIPDQGRRMIAFLGGTIGNLTPEPRLQFLKTLRSTMHPGDALLLGTDLVKPVERLLAAYDDPHGVTRRFNRNVLSVINRELDANFDPERFGHIAHWDPDVEWIEMRLRSLDDHIVKIPGIGLVVEFDEGEEMRTEVSAKFRRGGVEHELAQAGLELRNWWTDDAGDFALSLAVPA